MHTLPPQTRWSPELLLPQTRSLSPCLSRCERGVVPQAPCCSLNWHSRLVCWGQGGFLAKTQLGAPCLARRACELHPSGPLPVSAGDTLLREGSSGRCRAVAVLPVLTPTRLRLLGLSFHAFPGRGSVADGCAAWSDSAEAAFPVCFPVPLRAVPRPGSGL